MSGYLHGAHSVFAIHLHLVWITKYRKQALSYDIRLKCRDILREICRANDVEIIKGHVASDHIHLFVSIPPQVTISRLIQKLKGKSSFKLLHMFESLRRQYWGRHLWARGYFCCSSGNVTDEVIEQYIAQQQADDDDFRVEGDDATSNG